MKKNFTSICLLSIALLPLLQSCKKEDYRIPDYIPREKVDLGTHKLVSITLGSGDHTIVFENGLGTEMKIWVEPGVFEALAEENQVIAYNRGGYGNSELGPEPRNIPRLIAELNEIIETKSENEKVILVGHSLGGSYVRSYAVEYPEKVEALLLIEATHEDFITVVQDDENELVAGIRTECPDKIGTIKEAEQFLEAMEYLDTLPNLPDVPVIALASTKLENGITQVYIDQWLSVQESLGEGLSDFTLIATENSGHQIHVDEPQLVFDAIRQLLE